ncbi:MAG: MFS transporter [Nitrospinae bacterium]|nr:MFS transporter [Nitrospinota bacterium]
MKIMETTVTQDTENKIPWLLVIFSAVGYFVDLFDTFLLPALRVNSLKDLGVPDSESFAVYTMIMNSQLAGMVVGAFFLWGPVADTRGRKYILLWSIIVYSVANLLTAGVYDSFSYAIIRFFAGIGLGGELGAGVTLVTEAMPAKEQGKDRGIATMIIGFFGMFGVVTAAALAQTGLHWRIIYIIGGVMGIGILMLRAGIHDSRLFVQNKATNQTARQIDILRFLFSWPHVLKYIACILVGAPTFFVTGLLVPGAPEFAREFGMTELPKPTTALIYTYTSIAIGDILCGLLSKIILSRKYALLTFHFITGMGIASFLVLPPQTPVEFYLRCIIAGTGIGFWTNMVTNAAEQFGTNVRATVTITVPNLVRFLLFPISAAFIALKPELGIVSAAAVVGGTCSTLAIVMTLILRDGLRADLKYNEQI